MYTSIHQHAVEVADQKRSALSAHTYLGNSAHTQPAQIEGQRSWTEQGVSRPLAQLARRPAGSRARAGGAAQYFPYTIMQYPARARAVFRFST